MATWVECVKKVLTQLGGKGDIDDIVDRIGGMKSLKNNSHLRETVRGTLNSHKNIFKSYDGRGTWGLITHDTEREKKK